MLTDKAKEIISGVKSKMEDSVLFLEEDLKTYRVGKANPSILNNVTVDYYGTPTPVPQVASVTVPDARTIAIQPWEKNMIPVIEKAIINANLGFTPSNNGEVIRCPVPPLTEERRKELIKKAKATGENIKVAVRNARRDGVDARTPVDGSCVTHPVKQIESHASPQDIGKTVLRVPSTQSIKNKPGKDGHRR